MSTVTATCAHCEIKFQRELSAWNRAIAENRPMYCSHSCSTQASRTEGHTEVRVRCAGCGERFLRSAERVAKSRRNNKPMYCSLRCMGHPQSVSCAACGKQFTKTAKSIIAARLENRPLYCSSNCAGFSRPEKYTNNCADSGPREESRKVWGLSQRKGRKPKELRPFRVIVQGLNRRTAKLIALNRASIEKHLCFVTAQDVKDQWDKQKGICPYTGWPMTLRKSYKDKASREQNRGSLDRIDSSKPYTKDNIEFVSLAAQFAKNGWSSEELVTFCKAVVAHRG